jgi:hypothetical protein
MKQAIQKIKPTEGFSHIFYLLLQAILPLLILATVRLGVPAIAVVLVLLSKWRIFAVKPRYWVPNVRSNLVDIFVGLSVVAFTAGTEYLVTQIAWTILYVFWLVWLKPRSDSISVMAQALIAQAITIVAFYMSFPEQSLLVSIVVVWLVCYASARHFFTAFDEPLTRALTDIWAWFGAIMAWVLGHWVIEYLFLPQIALVLTVVGYGLATMYYLHQSEKLKASLRRQLISVIGVLLLIIIVFSDWQDKTI